MTLRFATKDDLDSIASLGAVMHAESSFSPMNYDSQKVKKTFSELIEARQFVVVSEHGGAVVGGMAGVCAQTWFGSDMIANDLALFIHPEHRGGLIPVRLIKSFVRWAELAGAKQIRPGVTTGSLAAEKIYEKLGFAKCGACFVMGV